MPSSITRRTFLGATALLPLTGCTTGETPAPPPAAPPGVQLERLIELERPYA